MNSGSLLCSINSCLLSHAACLGQLPLHMHSTDSGNVLSGRSWNTDVRKKPSRCKFSSGCVLLVVKHQELHWLGLTLRSSVHRHPVR